MSSKVYVEDTSIKGRVEEINIKVERVKKLLEEENLDALYLTRIPNFFWITAGADPVVTICTEDAVAHALITKDGKKYVITNSIEDDRMVEEQKLEELGFEVLTQNWFENKNAEYIKKIVGDLSKVGCDMHFEGTKMIADKLAPLRWSLTYNEICRYQYLGDYMSEALEKCLATVRPGMTEFEVTGIVARALWPLQIGQTLFLVASDERLTYRHPVPTTKKIEKCFMVSCNGRYKGLITTVTRMVHFGKPSAELLEKYDKNIDLENKIIAATKPGVDEIVPFRVCKEGYEEAGYGEMFYKHAQGGPMCYYNREYCTSESIHNVTQVNTCYCYNPVLNGTKTEDAFIATEDGPLFVTKPFSFPKIVKTVDGITMERPGMLVID